jgi:hypothetical protein
MIPLWINVFAFYALAFITKSRTFAILAFSAVINLAIDRYTSADSTWLMLVYSEIEFFTAIFILKYGDIQIAYQSILLSLMLVLHFFGQFAIINDNYYMFESGIYTFMMSILIIFQLLGAGCGTDKLNILHRPNPNRWKTRFPYLSDREAH